MNLLCLLTPGVPQRKSGTKEKRHASSMYLALQMSYYYMKCEVASTRFKPWTFTVYMIECWVTASFPPSSCDVCEQSLGCLVKIVVLFWEPDTKLQNNSLQKEWPYPNWATYLQLCRLRTFLSQQNWNFLGNLRWKRKNGTEGCVYSASSASYLLTVYPFWCTRKSNIIWILAATDIAFEDCILLLLRINSTLFFKQCPWPQGSKSLPHVNQNGISVIVVGSLKYHLIHFSHSSTCSCSLLSWSVEMKDQPHLQLYH